MSEEHHRVQQTLLVRGNALAKLQADLKAYSTRQGSFTLGKRRLLARIYVVLCLLFQ